jgi:DUF4097 and DUF4098 domain-containing protein YvlB
LIALRASALAVALALPQLAAAATDRQTRVVALPATGTLSIEITIGNIEIEASPRADAAIEIVRHAPNDDALKRIPIEIEETAGEIRVHGRQTDGGTNPAFRTDITLRVPLSARVGPVRVLEGRLRLSNLQGAINADVRRGSITAVDVSGTIRLETGIGDITVERAKLRADGLLRLRAFNGDVRLLLAERPVDARVMALALNGTIDSAIPLTMKDTWGPRWGEATLGKGEPVISLDVVTGKIVIRSP